MTLRVLHLVGSAVSEFHADLSRLYAADCLAATADPARYEPHIAVVSPDRRWRFPADLTPAAIAAAGSMDAPAALAHLGGLGLDVVVPQMFCLPGMTSYRALFDVLDVPVVGNPPDVMALGAHKGRTKAVAAAAGVAVPRGELLRRGDAPTQAPPVVIKPADADNSVGVALVRDPAGVPAALEAAFAHADEVLVEEYVELGREVRCGVIVRDGEPVALPLEEYGVDATAKPIRLADDKLARSADGDLGLVAKDGIRAWIVDADDPVTAVVSDAARRCHVALGCRHYSLFDFRVDPSGRPVLLEAGLYCSFAERSVISTMAAAAGLGVPELFAAAVAQALDR